MRHLAAKSDSALFTTERGHENSGGEYRAAVATLPSHSSFFGEKSLDVRY